MGVSDKPKEGHMICQIPDCEQPAVWVVPDYFNRPYKGGDTRDLLRCAVHGEEHKAMNPFLGWKRLR